MTPNKQCKNIMSLKTNSKDEDEHALFPFKDEHMHLVLGVAIKNSTELVNVLDSNLINNKK